MYRFVCKAGFRKTISNHRTFWTNSESCSSEEKKDGSPNLTSGLDLLWSRPYLLDSARCTCKVLYITFEHCLWKGKLSTGELLMDYTSNYILYAGCLQFFDIWSLKCKNFFYTVFKLFLMSLLPWCALKFFNPKGFEKVGLLV